MTIENYTQLTNDELLVLLDKLNNNSSRFGIFLSNHYPELLNELIERTKFLDEHFKDKVPIPARVYCIRHNISSHLTCKNKNCSNPVRWSGSENGFKTYCCIQCVNSDEDHRKNVENTMLKKYGTCCSFSNQSIRDKGKRTMLERYGVENFSMSREFKDILSDVWERKTKDEIDHIKEVRKITNMEKYGVEFPTQSESVANKTKQTNLERYDVEWSIRSKSVQSKARIQYLTDMELNIIQIRMSSSQRYQRQ